MTGPHDVTSHDTMALAVFTEDEVSRLTGLSLAQLRAWDRTSVFSPEFVEEDRSGPLSRLYSFRDLLCLRVLSTIRTGARLPSSRLRQTARRLARMDEGLWATTTLRVLDHEAVFDTPEAGGRQDVTPGRDALDIPLAVTRAEMIRSVRALRARDPATVGRITRSRDVAFNQPVIAGTRVLVSSIRAFAAGGYTADAILKEYPGLTEADIEAALADAAAA